MDLPNLRAQLRKPIRGNVLWGDEILDFYSVDSSFYQIMPKLVVFPKNAADVIRVLRFADLYSKKQKAQSLDD